MQEPSNKLNVEHLSPLDLGQAAIRVIGDTSMYFTTEGGGIPQTLVNLVGDLRMPGEPAGPVGDKFVSMHPVAPPVHNFKQLVPEPRKDLPELLNQYGLGAALSPFKQPDPLPLEDALGTAGDGVRAVQRVIQKPEFAEVQLDVVTPLVLESSIKESRYTSFKPQYTKGHSDKELMSKVWQVTQLYENSAHHAHRTYNEMWATMENNYYGAGNLMGQVGRLAAVEKMYKVARQREVPMDRQERFEFEGFLAKNFPTNIVGHALSDNFVNDYRALYLGQMKRPFSIQSASGRELNFKAVPVNMTANVGPLYSRGGTVVTRKQTLGQDFALAMELMTALKQNEDDDAHAFLKKYPYLQFVLVKPKAEVYPIQTYLQDQATAKTRNILVYNAGAMLPAAMLLKSAYAGADNFLNSAARNLLGMNLFKGGMNTLLNKMMEEDTSVAYADNVYATITDRGDRYLVSLDGEKHEASVTMDDAYQVYSRAALAYSNLDGLPVAWAKYVSVAAAIATSPIGLLKDQQIPLHQLGSGAQGTAYANQNRTTKFLFFSDKFTKPKMVDGVLSQDWIKFANDHAGTNFREEDPNARLSLGAMVRETNTGVVLRADILGFDTLNIAYLFPDSGIDQWVPILNRDRLMKAASFDKTGLTVDPSKRFGGKDDREKRQAETKVEKAQRFASLIMKDRSLYFLGGWKDPVLGPALILRTIAVIKRLTSLGIQVELNDDDMQLEGVEPGLQEAIRGFTRIMEPPSIGEVMELLLSPENFTLFVEHISKDPKREWGVWFGLSQLKRIKSLFPHLPPLSFAKVVGVNTDEVLSTSADHRKKVLKMFEFSGLTSWADLSDEPVRIKPARSRAPAAVIFASAKAGGRQVLKRNPTLPGKVFGKLMYEFETALAKIGDIPGVPYIGADPTVHPKTTFLITWRKFDKDLPAKAVEKIFEKWQFDFPEGDLSTEKRKVLNGVFEMAMSNLVTQSAPLIEPFTAMYSTLREVNKSTAAALPKLRSIVVRYVDTDTAPQVQKSDVFDGPEPLLPVLESKGVVMEPEDKDVADKLVRFVQDSINRGPHMRAIIEEVKATYAKKGRLAAADRAILENRIEGMLKLVVVKMGPASKETYEKRMKELMAEARRSDLLRPK